MGHLGRFRIGVGLTQHHQRAVGRRRPHPIQRRHAHQGIGGSHPPQPQVSPLHRLDLLPHRQAGFGRDRTGSKAPVPLHLSAVLGVCHNAIAGQQLGQATGLTPPHGIGLAREREGARPLPPDLTGDQMQIDDPRHGGGALAALVHPHGPETEHSCRSCPPLGQLAQIGFADPTEITHPLRRPGLPERRQFFKALRVGSHEALVDRRGLQQQVAHAVQEHQIRAGAKRQVQISGITGGRSPGIHHHQTQGLPVFALALQQPLKQHRMAVGRIGADQHHQVSHIEIVVAAGRAIGAEAAGIAGHGRTHAQA